MKFLVDSNVWLELLLAQQAGPEAKAFIDALPSGSGGITDFALFSIALRLRRVDQSQLFDTFLGELDRSGTEVVSLSLAEIRLVWKTIFDLQLDFDDAYQYVAAEARGLELVSFDADFDATPRRRLTPAQARETLGRSTDGGDHS